MNLAEIRVTTDRGNVITTSTSVTFSSGYRDRDQSFVDGSSDTSFATPCCNDNLCTETSSWVSVDLGSTYSIYKIDVANINGVGRDLAIGIVLSIVDGSQRTVYTSMPISRINSLYTWAPPDVNVYGSGIDYRYSYDECNCMAAESVHYFARATLIVLVL